jgi:sigma-B regulation protein RsbU (phosphoserine phosphatase)
MLLAPTLDDEQDRLASLHALAILDTPAEERFDRIVKLAAEVLQVPVAYIALIDSDRQWFKAKIGVDLCQTDRSTSFCGHTIQQNEPLIIEDARLDDRFRDNPLVIGDPFVRFYAGYPLSAESGHNVATLCLADRVPRQMTDQQHRLFSMLAAQAEREIRLVDLVQMQHQMLDVKSKLLATQQQLDHELVEAAAYVRSLLPDRLQQPVRTDWEYIPSSALGGDLLGYHWLDEEHLAIYLLDVMGHGVGAALLSASIRSALINHSFSHQQMRDPGQLLCGLNRDFPMAKGGGRFFTMWYGVYSRRTRTLKYANAGHPAGLLFRGENKLGELSATGTIIGIESKSKYETVEWGIPSGARLYLYSDGLSELDGYNGIILSSNDLARIINQDAPSDGTNVQKIVTTIRSQYGINNFKDDVSLLELKFA